MILEIWRKMKMPGLPVVFTIGESPKFLNDDGILTPIEESPPVKNINFYETGAFKGQAYRGPCYVIAFEESNHRRIIPAVDAFDILFAVPEKSEVKTPALEG